MCYFDVLQKRDVMNPMWDGGNMLRKKENSAKSGKVGMSENSAKCVFKFMECGVKNGRISFLVTDELHAS